VSVGEVKTSLPLIRALQERFPDGHIGLSVATFTGFEVARKSLPQVDIFYAPLDLSLITARVFRRRRPTALVLVELELWPNFLMTARRRGVPVFVVNGRITERSARRYRKVSFLSRRLFRCVDGYAVQDEAYRERFLGLGVEPGRVEVLGNLKHDVQAAAVGERVAAVRAAFGWTPGTVSVLVGGSTHPGEENLLLRLLEKLRLEGMPLALILVPRHVERLSESEVESWHQGLDGVPDPLWWSQIRQQVESGGGEPHEGTASRQRESKIGGPEPGALKGARDLAPLVASGAVLVVDTVGELELFYALADIAFVGGSLVPHGGHNVLEPARHACPVLFGSHVGNFLLETECLERAGGGRRLSGADELEVAVRELLGDDDARAEMGARARGAARLLSGSTERHVRWLEDALRLPLPPAC